MQTKRLYKTLIGNEDKIRRPDNLPENPSDEQRLARDAQQRRYTIKAEEKENRNNYVRCYSALLVDSTISMTMRHDCLNADGMGDEEAAWMFVLDWFCINKATTVVSVVS